MATTRRDLASRALSKLGVLASGQSPEAEDVALVIAMIDPMLAEMAQRSVIYIALTGTDDEIDPAYFDKVADILAGIAAADFGRASDQVLLGKMLKAESDLKIMSMTRPSFEIMTAEYF